MNKKATIEIEEVDEEIKFAVIINPCGDPAYYALLVALRMINLLQKEGNMKIKVDK